MILRIWVICLEFIIWFELEGEISIRETDLKFLNRAVTTLPVYKEMIKPKESSYVKVESLFWIK